MDHIEQLLKALADQNRLRIVGLLSHKDYCVCELAHVLKITQPSVSKHLKKLKSSGIIDSRQDGLWTSYFLSPLENKDNQKILSSITINLIKTPQVQKDISKAEKTSRDDLC